MEKKPCVYAVDMNGKWECGLRVGILCQQQRLKRKQNGEWIALLCKLGEENGKNERLSKEVSS